MKQMTSRARVMAALRGEPVDQVPVSLWGHHYGAENSAIELSDETVRLARDFAWDYLKPQSRAQCFAEMWGLTYEPSTQRAVPYTLIKAPVTTAADLKRLQPAVPDTGALGEQLEALRSIRSQLGPEIPITWTVFSAIFVARYLLAGGEAQVLEILRSDPTALEAALEAITDTLMRYAELCVQAGADGIFLATTLATQEKLTLKECERFQRKYDLRILGAVEQAPFNIMHVCRDRILFDQFVDYPVAAFSWATVPGNPSLAEGHQRTGRAAIGGIPAKTGLKSMTETQIREGMEAAVAEMSGRWLLFGPHCSIDPGMPELVLLAARDAARQIRP
jgi:uroporphyrinogen decarboxylase